MGFRGAKSHERGLSIVLRTFALAVLAVSFSVAELPQCQIDALCAVAELTECQGCNNGCGSCGAYCNGAKNAIIKLSVASNGKYIYDIPPTIGNMTNLQSLSCDNNRITAVPGSFHRLSQLTCLSLQRNLLRVVPPVVESFRNLKYLRLSQNRISVIPDNITKLSNLIEMDFSTNTLSTLPSSMGDLTNLQSLFIDENKFCEFPTVISELGHLQSLGISKNQLDVVPDSVISRLVSLESFEASMNLLSTLPSSISKLGSLSYLSIAANRFAKVPEILRESTSMQFVYLQENYLTELPDFFGNMSGLGILRLERNQLTSLPENLGNLKLEEFNIDFNFLTCSSLSISGPYATAIKSKCDQKTQRSCSGLGRSECTPLLVCKWDERAGACVKGTDCLTLGDNMKCSQCKVGFGLDTSGICKECALQPGTWGNGIQCTSCLTNYCTQCTPTTGECTKCKYVLRVNGKCSGPEWAIAVGAVGGTLIIALALAPAVVIIRRRLRRAEESEATTALLVPASAPRRSLIGLSHIPSSDGYNLGVAVSPRTLTFGSQRSPLPVNRTVTETLTITGTSRKSDFTLLLPDECPDRYLLKTSMVKGTVASKKVAEIKMELTLFCTTRVELCVFIIVDEKRFTRIDIKAESALSSRFDASELEIGALLGTGGFGSVYRGMWRGSVVAIKSYNESVVNDEIMRSDIEREVEMCTALRHSNIVTFFGSARAPGKFFIVMEIVDHGALDTAVSKGPLDPKFKVRVLLDIARGMYFLHQNRIIHRDLKTSNVLISSFDPSAAVCGKLSDFNTSRFVGSESVAKTKGVGTPIFMAPEILSMSKYSNLADVYSFGVLAWNVWTQKEPYAEFLDQFAIIKYVLSDMRLPIPDGTPDGIKAVITSSWDSEPSNRPTFQKLVSDLSAITL